MMKKLFFALGITLLATFASAQEYIEPVEKWKAAEVWGNNYHGWSFHQDWEVDFTVENQDGRFTPTDAEIADAERLIQKKMQRRGKEKEKEKLRLKKMEKNISIKKIKGVIILELMIIKVYY